MNNCIAIVVAAGKGARFGGEKPKQYENLGSKPIIRLAIEAFLNNSQVHSVQPVINADHLDFFKETMKNINVLPPVIGGERRQDSVKLALESLAGINPDTVLIHDAARPLIEQDIIDKIIDALRKGAEAAVPVLPIRDTVKIKRYSSENIETLPRRDLYASQTPQGFKFKTLLAAHKKHYSDFHTDDASIMEAEGKPVTFIKGSLKNMKITQKDDLKILSDLYGETKTGLGFDVHRFTEGSGIILGGVKIPMKKSLLGHSDADVVLHAITDSILGASGENDIGTHFPPSNDKYKNNSSEIFLKFSNEKLQSKNGRIVHLDITLICEQPKILPHREEIQKSISNILDIPLSAINIKATTTEGLGFLGREEGIACQAVATVKMFN